MLCLSHRRPPSNYTRPLLSSCWIGSTETRIPILKTNPSHPYPWRWPSYDSPTPVDTSPASASFACNCLFASAPSCECVRHLSRPLGDILCCPCPFSSTDASVSFRQQGSKRQSAKQGIVRAVGGEGSSFAASPRSGPREPWALHLLPTLVQAACLATDATLGKDSSPMGVASLDKILGKLFFPLGHRQSSPQIPKGTTGKETVCIMRLQCDLIHAPPSRQCRHHMHHQPRYSRPLVSRCRLLRVPLGAKDYPSNPPRRLRGEPPPSAIQWRPIVLAVPLPSGCSCTTWVRSSTKVAPPCAPVHTSTAPKSTHS